MSAGRRLEGVRHGRSGVRSRFSTHILLSCSVSHPPPIQMHHKISEVNDEARKLQPAPGERQANRAGCEGDD
eukprot:scaffold9933_cov44-Phaeocystis_antarctica.AAC.2